MAVNINKNSRDWQRALFIPLTVLAWLAVAVIGVWILSHLVKTVLTLILSGLVAFALTPLVSLLSRFMPRGFAIAVAYLLGFTILFGLVTVLIVTAAEQVTNLVGTLKTQDVTHRYEPQILRVLGPFGVTHAKFQHAQDQATTYLGGIGTSAAKQSLDIVSSVLATIVDAVLVLILSVYLTANGSRIASRLRSETPGRQRRHTILLIAIVNQVVGGYIRGTLLMATLIGVLVGVGMFVLHVPYAVLLGVLAFFMEFIPVIGVLISGAVCILVALFVGPITALLVLGYFVIVHVIEGDVIGPRVMGRAVGIHPATALIALVAGTELFGFWGALFAAPLAGLVQSIGTAAIAELRGGDPSTVLHAVKSEVEDEVRGEINSTLRRPDESASPIPRSGGSS